jgi:hypothetical protein
MYVHVYFLLMKLFLLIDWSTLVAQKVAKFLKSLTQHW